MEKIMKSKARAVSVDVEGTSYTAIEFSEEIMQEMNLVEGEIFDVSVEGGNMTITRTGIVYNGDRET